ncbi:hypothetical protein BACCOP_03390 [Phocaeicola coprocola DSM 17136]|uniref:Uncharacterized protein n=1 Tax=Phocaeicola coprocola DSM 17136 TaxID=470145 RepID=B3JN77_9BACT|nr:hypothetical protein BACCOP_03390 [Phocaeicola coprocola DSM 17136]
MYPMFVSCFVRFYKLACRYPSVCGSYRTGKRGCPEGCNPVGSLGCF